MTAPFARVEKQELPESWKVVFDGAPGIPGMDFYEKRVAESIADRFNVAFHARCAPLVEALEKIGQWKFNIMGDCVSDAIAVARDALKEFRK